MAIITIDTQYYENYGFHEGTTHWKPKGGHKFTMEVSSDVAIWTDDMKGKLSKIVEKQSNDMEKFEYIDHEVIFHNPTELSYDLLMKEIDIKDREYEV